MMKEEKDTRDCSSPKERKRKLLAEAGWSLQMRCWPWAGNQDLLLGLWVEHSKASERIQIHQPYINTLQYYSGAIKSISLKYNKRKYIIYIYILQQLHFGQDISSQCNWLIKVFFWPWRCLEMSLGFTPRSPIKARPPKGHSRMWSVVQPQLFAAMTWPNSWIKT